MRVCSGTKTMQHRFKNKSRITGGLVNFLNVFLFLFVVFVFFMFLYIMNFDQAPGGELLNPKLKMPNPKL